VPVSADSRGGPFTKKQKTAAGAPKACDFQGGAGGKLEGGRKRKVPADLQCRGQAQHRQTGWNVPRKGARAKKKNSRGGGGRGAQGFGRQRGDRRAERARGVRRDRNFPNQKSAGEFCGPGPAKIETGKTRAPAHQDRAPRALATSACFWPQAVSGKKTKQNKQLQGKGRKPGTVAGRGVPRRGEPKGGNQGGAGGRGAAVLVRGGRAARGAGGYGRKPGAMGKKKGGLEFR